MNADAIRKKRLIQINWGVIAAQIVLVFISFAQDQLVDGLLLIASTSFSLASLRLAYRERLDLAAQLLLGSIVVVVVLIILCGSGLRDLSVLALPGIIIFSAMIGRPRLTLLLFAGIILFILTLGFCYELGWLLVPVQQTNFLTALSVAVIISIVSLAIIGLHNDLLQLIASLHKENQRVRESAQEIEFLHLHDSLTRLPNRTLARDLFVHSFGLVNKEQKHIAVLFLDLDNFKHINDSLGHRLGDQLLGEVAARLSKSIRQTDTVARLGGDEFLLLAEHTDNELTVSALAGKVLASIGQPFHFQDQVFELSASLGVAIAPKDGDEFDDLVKKAEMAMYEAKKHGKNTFRYFDLSQQDLLKRQLSLIQQMKEGLSSQEFSLAYQPKVCLQTGSIIGAEALLRWCNKVHGQVPPDEFIGLAEYGGLIHSLGEFVLRQSCLDSQRIIRAGHKNFQVGVNVSVMQFKDDDFLNLVEAALNESGLQPQALDIEITESLLLNRVDAISNRLEQLKQMGVSISIDDFGTGYSNLGYLKHFKVNTLKIDRSFIYQLYQHQENQTIVKTILQLCRGLEMEAVAEGIEDEQTANILSAWGCRFGQGFYWAKPVPLEEFLPMLEN